MRLMDSGTRWNMASSNSPVSSPTSRYAASPPTTSGEILKIPNTLTKNKENSNSNNVGGNYPAIGQTPLSEDHQARRRGRKGHTKSRTGCYNCKKARIKVCSHSKSWSGERLIIFSAKKTAHHVITVPTGVSNATGQTSRSIKSGH